ncbi:MAG: GTPase Era [Candidatus Omnitrophota bacterium]
MYKAGKVSIVGRPNVGKSTLLNALVKEKVCIVSSKPETTRDNIQGIISGKEFQVVFIDTPGMHKPKTLLGKSMVRRASSTFLEADIILLLIDAHSGINQEDRRIIQELSEKPVFLIINKIDRIETRFILPIIEEASKYSFKEIIPISASKQNGTDLVFKTILKYLPEGYPIFPEDQLSDKSERFFVQELIREKILGLTHQEVPHSIAVLTEEMEERKNRANKDIYYIRTTIYVEKDSQKSIIIGKKGDMLKRIGELSRKEIEDLLQKKVFLDLWVKVKENWRKDAFILKSLGY